ncbi:DUF2752 domain-containing protein [Actinocorallia aurantiaca]
MEAVGGRSRWRALAAPLGVLAAGVAGVAVVGLVSPYEAGHYPVCPFLGITGWYCPGCGGLRMTYDLAHGRIAQAFSRNALVFVMVPVAAYLWGLWTVASWRGTAVRTRLGSRVAIVALTGSILVFWVLRNLPFGRALAP